MFNKLLPAIFGLLTTRPAPSLVAIELTQSITVSDALLAQLSKANDSVISIQDTLSPTVTAGRSFQDSLDIDHSLMYVNYRSGNVDSSGGSGQFDNYLGSIGLGDVLTLG